MLHLKSPPFKTVVANIAIFFMPSSAPYPPYGTLTFIELFLFEILTEGTNVCMHNIKNQFSRSSKFENRCVCSSEKKSKKITWEKKDKILTMNCYLWQPRLISTIAYCIVLRVLKFFSISFCSCSFFIKSCTEIFLNLIL